MWYWKNNGPKPPWDNDEIVLILAGLIDITAMSWFLRYVLVSAYNSYLAWKHLVR
jgi:hypothetical protein